jgi:hypothetical protein
MDGCVFGRELKKDDRRVNSNEVEMESKGNHWIDYKDGFALR